VLLMIVRDIELLAGTAGRDCRLADPCDGD
jgi:hypothetical protein